MAQHSAGEADGDDGGQARRGDVAVSGHRESGGVMLLDTATLYFRAFHALPSSLKAPDGRPHGAIRGTLDMLATLVTRLRPRQVVACWDDDWRPAWRVAALPSYKAHRVATDGSEDVPAGLDEQVEGVITACAALGVPRIGAADAEADDVVGTLATRVAAEGQLVEVISGDRDLLQLVDDGDVSADRGAVRVTYIGGGVREAPRLDAAALAARCGLTGAALTREGGVGQAYADLALLRGDPSDGLPGVAGIGEKTAASLLARFTSVIELLEAARGGDERISARQRSSLLDAADYLTRADTVVRVRRDLPLDLPQPPSSLLAAVDGPALQACAEAWGLTASAGRVLEAFGSAS